MQELFQSTADMQFNSFEAPLNPFNTNGGGWGMDGNYVTPAFAAPYRPGYRGSDNYHAANPGFFSALNNTMGPGTAYSSPAGWDSYQNRNAWESVATKPSDSMMWTAQRIAMPIAAYMMTEKMLGARKFAQTNAVAGSVSGWAAKTLGMSEATQTAWATKTSGAFRIGSAVGETASRLTLGAFGARGAAAAAVSGGVGMAVGMAARMYLPIWAADKAMDAFNYTVADPYMTQRGIGTDLRRNFSNTVMMGGGSSFNGFGLSYKASNSIARDITDQGVHDYTFSTKDFRGITDMSARAGLLNNVSTDQISSRIKQITSQLKTAMAVTGSSDFKEMISLLGQLQTAGASPGTGAAGNMLSKMGYSAAASGISVRQMMDTHAAQGGYLYGANGLTPIVGMMNAASTFAGITSAYRTGLVNDATIARLGGVAGASQLATTAAVNSAQTPYNHITMFNRYFGGGDKGSVVGNLAAFGQKFGSDPMNSYGLMQMYKGNMLSAGIAEEGANNLAMRQLKEQAALMPNAWTKDGKIKLGAAFSLLKAQGLGDEQIQALLLERQGMQDQGSADFRKKTALAAYQRERAAILEQEGYGTGPILSPVVRGTRSLGKAIQSFGHDLTQPLHAMSTFTGDYLQRLIYEGKYGKVSGIAGELSSHKSPYMAGSAADMVDKTLHFLAPGERHIIANSGDVGDNMSYSKFSTEGAGAVKYKRIDKAARRKLMDEVGGEFTADDSNFIAEYTKYLKDGGKEFGATQLNDLEKFAVSKGFKGNTSRYHSIAQSFNKNATYSGLIREADTKSYESQVHDRWSKVVKNKDGDLGAMQIAHLAKKIFDRRATDDERIRFNKIMGLKPGAIKESNDLASKIVDSAINQGVLQSVHALDAFDDKTGRSAGLALNQALKDPGSFFGSDTAAAAAFKKADLATQQKMVAHQIRNRAGVMAISNDVGNATWVGDTAVKARLDDANSRYQSEIQKIDSDLKAGLIDFGGAKIQEAAAKMSAAIDNFGQYVQVFGRVASGDKAYAKQLNDAAKKAAELSTSQEPPAGTAANK